MKSIPKIGLSKEEVLQKLEAIKSNDIDWRKGRNFAYVYHPGNELGDTIKLAYLAMISENALNPTSFPSLKKMENEVLSMTTLLLHGDEKVKGSMTTGGTESIMMTVFSARQYARNERKIKGIPNIIVPHSVHPAFFKAGHYFDVEIRPIKLLPDYSADVELMKSAIDSNTIMLVGSAPSYPHGIMDPIEKIAACAMDQNVLCHVDACVGGFMLPFLKMEGIEIPAFDFNVDGVTSISADLHKYGYASKGASVILYKTEALRKHQFYAYTEWNGGIYVSPTMTGTRPGGAIASAHAALTHIGIDGYKKLIRVCYDAAAKIQDAVKSIDGISIIGNPLTTIFAIRSERDNHIYQIGDELAVAGWSLDRQQFPPSLHLSINPTHGLVVDEFIDALKAATDKAGQLSMSKISADIQVGMVKGLKKVLPNDAFEMFQSFAGKHSDAESKRTAAMYGIIGALREGGDLNEMVIDMLSRMFDHES